MRERLEKIIAAYQELEQKLMDPAVVSNPKEYARLAKEHASQGRARDARPASTCRPSTTSRRAKEMLHEAADARREGNAPGGHLRQRGEAPRPGGGHQVPCSSRQTPTTRRTPSSRFAPASAATRRASLRETCTRCMSALRPPRAGRSRCCPAPRPTRAASRPSNSRSPASASTPS